MRDEILQLLSNVMAVAPLESDIFNEASGLSRKLQSDMTTEPWSTLSDREREVAKYLIAGLTNAEIAKIFDISVKTIDTHRGHVLRKLGCSGSNGNVKLIRLAIETGVYR